MGFELCITNSAPSPSVQQKKRKRSRSQGRPSVAQPQSASGAVAPLDATAVEASSIVIVEESDVEVEVTGAETGSVQATAPLEQSSSSRDDGKVGKRVRYAASSMTSPGLVVRKQDPAKAAPLPTTLPLEAKRSSTAFSASSFDELPLDEYLLKQIKRMRLNQLTPVQQQAIPRVLGGRNLLVRSPTGSGKTLAYAVPGVQALLQAGPQHVTRAAGTFMVVLVPTRELCLQTHEVIEQLCRPFPWLVSGTLMGGERRKAEKVRRLGKLVWWKLVPMLRWRRAALG